MDYITTKDVLVKFKPLTLVLVTNLAVLHIHSN